MRINPEFPEYHHNDPKRQAELRVYQEIEATQISGQTLYGVKAARHSPEVDFVVWAEDVACFAIEVKGGAHWMENGTLFRQGPSGPEQVANPLRKAMDGTLSISNAVKNKLQGGAFVISVLLFPDMEEHDEVQRWAQGGSRTNVVFGVDELIQRLTELDDVQDVRHRPSAYRPSGLPHRAGGRRPDARGAAGGQPGALAQGLAHGPPHPARGDPEPGGQPVRRTGASPVRPAGYGRHRRGRSRHGEPGLARLPDRRYGLATTGEAWAGRAFPVDQNFWGDELFTEH